jgi:putative multiple sugar transport system substrate-binding protein
MRSKLFSLIALLTFASFLLAACGGAAPQTPAAPTAASGGATAPTAAAAEAPTAAPAAAPTAATTGGTALAVGIVLPTKDETRWTQDEARFKEALDKAGYQVEILFSEKDSAKEKTNVESLITKGVKVLIICPFDGTAAAAAADEAHKAGIKVISYDRLIRDTDAVDYYVTFDSIAVGAQQAQYLVDKAGSTKGNPLYIYAGAATDNNAFIFFQGAWGVLQPKIADGTFVIKNSSEAIGLQSKAELTRDEEAKIIAQVTTDWAPATAKNLAESNLTTAQAADKGNVFILAPNDDTSRAIGDTFAADKDVKSFVITGQDAAPASVQYIIDGKQSMTVFKDVRTLVSDAIKAAVALLSNQAPAAKGSYNNGKIDVPAIQSPVISVDKANVKAALFDSGYYKTSDYTGLDATTAAPTAAPAAVAPGAIAVGIVLPTKDETRWTQDEARFKEALDKAGYQVEILFSEKDSAKEKTNVESLITKGVKVLIIFHSMARPLRRPQMRLTRPGSR